MNKIICNVTNVFAICSKLSQNSQEKWRGLLKSICCHHEANRGVKIFYYKGRREVRRNPNRFTTSYPIRKLSKTTAVLLIAFRFFWKAGSSSTTTTTTTTIIIIIIMIHNTYWPLSDCNLQQRADYAIILEAKYFIKWTAPSPPHFLLSINRQII